MSKKVKAVQLYSLYHVNTKNGLAIKFGTETANDGMDKATAERRAKDVREGKGRGSIRIDNWTVLALPINDKGVLI